MSILPVPLLGLDPSSTKIGWGLIGPGPSYINSGVYRLPTTAPQDERVLMVGSAINTIVAGCRENGYSPALALIEVPDFVAVYAKPHVVVYHRAVGVAEYAVHLCGLPIVRVAASKEKYRTRKQEYKDRFRRIVGRYADDDDESDALCLAWDHLTALMGGENPTR